MKKWIKIAGLLLFSMSLNTRAEQYGNLLYSSDGSVITITGFSTAKSGDNFVIPLTINGLPVTRIGELAFSAGARWNVDSVTIGNNVTNIGNWAFSGCYYMTTVTMGSKVNSIGAQAFSGCKSLTQITIPGDLTGIWGGTFEDCIGLTNVTINSSVINIESGAFRGCTNLLRVTVGAGVSSLIMGGGSFVGSGAFSGCDKLSTIAVDTQNPFYSSVDGVLFNKNGTMLVGYPPGKASSIYTVPIGAISIGNYAFAGCTGLTDVTIPNGVTTIGDGAFGRCASLNSVTIPYSVTSIGYLAFYNCTSLSSITLPNSVTNIGSSVFSGCSSLSSITLPNSVTSIEESAFASCTNLSAVTIPSSVNFIDMFAFDNCQSLSEIYFQGNVPLLSSRHFWTASAAGGGTQYFDGTNSVFYGNNNATVYYLPGATGWDTTFCNRPTELWDNSGTFYLLTVNGGTGSGSYTNRHQVTITANAPAVGTTFDRWTGTIQYVASITSSATTVTMPVSNVSLTATYKNFPGWYTLTVNSGTGGGSYTNQQQVEITANVPVAGQVFDRWVGETQYVASATSSPTIVTMPAKDIAITATYKDIQYTLTVIGGTGSGTTYTNQQQVTITANALAVGKTFDRWTGDTQHVDSVTSTNTTVTMPAEAVSLTATYVDVYYALTVNNGTGDGSFTNETQVTIAADAPAGGKAFSQWAGDTQYVASVTSSPTIVTMPASNIAVTATYRNAPDLLITNVGYSTNFYLLGETLGVSLTETNAGPAAAGKFAVTGVLSTNAVWSNANNIILGTNITTGLAVGAGLATNFVYSIRQTIPVGIYYLGLMIDSTNGITESIETNNVWWSASKNVRIATGGYLTVSNGAGSGVYTSGTPVVITATNAPSGKVFDRWTGATQYLASMTSSPTTVMMPASNIAVTATYKDIQYTLTVTGGSGGGTTYTNQQRVAIAANPPVVGMVFDRWIGTTQYVASVTSSTTVVTMPAASILVSATYKNGFTLTVNGGSGGGLYADNTQVAISANTPEGKAFVRWTGDTQYVASVASSTTTVTMPAQAVSLTATYKDIYALTVTGGSGGGWYDNASRVTIAAYVRAGQAFTRWTGATQYVASVTSSTTTVTMPAGAVGMTATYVADTKKPKLKITSPTSKARIVATNGLFTVRGLAADKMALADVRVQLNGGSWTNAITTNGWRTWSLPVKLISGTNTIRAYCVDSAVNNSSTATVVFTYAPGAVMTVQTNGAGAITPAYNGTVLEIGKSYEMQAKVASGSVFTNWTYGLGGTVATNKSKIIFVMQSNLVLTANFRRLPAMSTLAGIAIAASAAPQVSIKVDGLAEDWANIPHSSFSYASVTQEVAVALDGNNIALLLNGCPFSTSDTVMVYFKLRLSYGAGDNRHSVDLWTSGSVLYGMVDGQVIAGLEAVLLNGVLEVKLPVEQAPSQVTIEEIGCGMDLGAGTLTELFRVAPAVQ